MTRTQATLSALAAVLCCAAAPAPADNGRDLAAQCQQALRLNALGVEALDVDEVIEGVYCVGYIGGLLDGMIVAEEEIEPRSARARPTVCLPPDGLDMAQAVRVVLAWLEGHPEDLSEPARVAVHRALADAFPCERKRPPAKKRP
ncbi:MAG: hypothetical protein MUF66_12420 [Gammaproteobacteria bacterium]|jgi:hypothetical protein|nr:hypothetical protein [Gammaproteobacteria bacterium]